MRKKKRKRKKMYTSCGVMCGISDSLQNKQKMTTMCATCTFYTCVYEYIYINQNIILERIDKYYNECMPGMNDVV